ncbi:MAG: ABC transporter substrate-binding protein [Gammaproteobacteria bacterium]
MIEIRQNGAVVRWAGLFTWVAALAGCATVPLRPGADLPPPAPAVPPAEPAGESTPEPVHVAILVSDDLPVYTATAAALERRLGDDRYTTFSLHGDETGGERIVAQLARTGAKRLVTIGLLATRAGRRYSDLPMVFCQVFNYSDDGLIGSTSGGVNLLPPFADQLRVWKQISPKLRRVGVIVGPNQNELIARATESAREQQVELISRVVNSDREAVYVFKRLVPRIDGLWLLPDNRILSPQVIREIMTYASKHQRQVVVFNPNLLNLGGLMSVSGRESDVAEQVVAILDSRDGEGIVPRPSMTPLTELRVEINPRAARELGLSIPATLARYLRRD